MKFALIVLLNGVLGENVLMDQDQDLKLSLKKPSVQELLVQNCKVKVKLASIVLLNGVLGESVLMEQDQDLKL